MMDEHRSRLSFLERRLEPEYEKLVVTVAPGDTWVYDESQWLDAIVVLERGQIELESTAGDRRRFVQGDVMCLAGVPLRALHNRGREDAILVAVSRRRGPTD